eukprot:2079012-Pyramimonas_sp.AAC.1
MDFPLYPDYHAQVTGNPRVEAQPESPSVPGQIPHCGYLATPMDSDVTQQVPSLVVPLSMGELRPEILAIHEAQQANLSMQWARQRRNRVRRANRVLGRAGQPATPIAAGAPAFNPAALAAMQPPSVLPIQHEVGETTLGRQTRIRPSATPPVISDGR